MKGVLHIIARRLLEGELRQGQRTTPTAQGEAAKGDHDIDDRPARCERDADSSS